MLLVKNFLSVPPHGNIRAKLEFMLDQGNSGVQGTFTNIEERARFVKSMLGLLQELSFDRDVRMGFVEHSKWQFLSLLITFFFYYSLHCNAIPVMYDWSGSEVLDDLQRLRFEQPKSPRYSNVLTQESYESLFESRPQWDHELKEDGDARRSQESILGYTFHVTRGAKDVCFPSVDQSAKAVDAEFDIQADLPLLREALWARPHPCQERHRLLRLHVRAPSWGHPVNLISGFPKQRRVFRDHV